MKSISTKNLYLCRLEQIKKQIYDPMSSVTATYFDHNISYVVLARKEHDKYIDAITNTEYKSHESDFYEGECIVVKSIPIITNENKIPLAVATKILMEANPVYISSDKIIEEKPKKLIKLRKKDNYAK